MSRSLRCRICGGFACSALCLTLAAAAEQARAQAARPLVSPVSIPVSTPVTAPLAPPSGGSGTTPQPVGSTTGVEIGGMFMAVPSRPVLEPDLPGADCGDASCLRGVITVRANMRWQLQVRLIRGQLPPTSVWWRPPVRGVSALLLGDEWQTLLTGPVPTAGSTVALRYVARSQDGVPDREGVALSSALSAALEYRVVAW